MKCKRLLVAEGRELFVCDNVILHENLTVTLREKVQAVEGVFAKLDEEIRSFQERTALHCKYGCGKCCFKSDIEATILEFLPFAQHLKDNGLAHEWLESLKDHDGPICRILNPTRQDQGLCTQYTHRGLICRLFGYSARTNKHGKKELVTCQVIKSEQQPQFELAVKGIEDGGEVPVMSNYYMQLFAIDQQLAQDFYPVNEAIKKAIETVLHYYAYRE